MQKRVIGILLFLVIAASSVDWRYMSDAPLSNRESNFFPYNLQVGDTIQFTVFGNSAWTGDVSVGTFFYVVLRYQQSNKILCPVNSPGVVECQVYTVPAGQAGQYKVWAYKKEAPPVYANYQISIKINNGQPISVQGLTFENPDQYQTGYQLTLPTVASYRFVKNSEIFEGKWDAYLIESNSVIKRLDEDFSFTMGNLQFFLNSSSVNKGIVTSLSYINVFTVFSDYDTMIGILPVPPFTIEIDFDSIQCPPGLTPNTQTFICESEPVCISNSWTTTQCQCVDASNIFFQEILSCCPANAGYVQGYTTCQCDPGYVWNAGQTQCESEPVCISNSWTTSQCQCVDASNIFFQELLSCCPVNAGYVQGYTTCQCDPGYVWNVDKTQCLLCPENQFTLPIATIDGGCQCFNKNFVWSDAYFSCVPPGIIKIPRI